MYGSEKVNEVMFPCNQVIQHRDPPHCVIHLVKTIDYDQTQLGEEFEAESHLCCIRRFEQVDVFSDDSLQDFSVICDFSDL